MTTEHTWHCRDGRVLKISEMATNHIENCIAMLRRLGRVTPGEFLDAIRFAHNCRGDGAVDAAENEIANMQMSGKLSVLVRELERRKSSLNLPRLPKNEAFTGHMRGVADGTRTDARGYP